MALSLYRKYRPNVFADVVGQDHVERTLVNAVTEGTVASAYLFCGPRGTGKTTTARLLAKALLCERGPGHEPDGTCEQCRAIAEGAHPDVYELDAASRTGVDNVRDEIISRVQFSPTRGRYKVYIIDEVHMLSIAAFNALLKTLEEPPEHVVFILCTTDPHKVPETIQSRCQRFDFRRLSVAEIVGYLERICKGEGFSYEASALEYIASKSAGGMRDATTMLEQVAVYTEGRITLAQTTGLFGQLDASGLFELSGYIAAGDTASCFLWLDRLVGTGIDLSQFAHELASYFRDLYVTALTGGEDGIVKCAESELPVYRQQAAAFGTPERLSHALTVCGDLVNELRNSNDARLSVEVALTRLCRPQSDLTLEGLAERIAALEAGMPQPQRPQPQRPQGSQRQAQPAAPHEQVASHRPAAAPLAQPAAQPQARPQGASRPQAAPQPQRPQQRPPAQPQPQPRQEAPAPAPQPQPAGGMSPARLLAALLTVVKREDMATGALLGGVTLQQEGERYHLSFPKGSEFAMGIASKGSARDLIARAFREVLGHDVDFDCRPDSLAAAERANAVQEEARRSSSGGFRQDSPAPAYPAAPPDDDRPPIYEEPVYDRGYDAGGYDAPVSFAASPSYGSAPDFSPGVQVSPEPNFDAPANARTKPIDDETAANLADALSAFGDGVKVQEVDDDQ